MIWVLRLIWGVLTGIIVVLAACGFGMEWSASRFTPAQKFLARKIEERLE
jgi:hypothetical protein